MEPFRLLARLYNAKEFNDLRWIGKTMSGKYEVSGMLHSVLRKQHDAGRKPPVCVMQQDLAVLENHAATSLARCANVHNRTDAGDEQDQEEKQPAHISTMTTRRPLSRNVE